MLHSIKPSRPIEPRVKRGVTWLAIRAGYHIISIEFEHPVIKIGRLVCFWNHLLQKNSTPGERVSSVETIENVQGRHRNSWMRTVCLLIVWLLPVCQPPLVPIHWLPSLTLARPLLNLNLCLSLSTSKLGNLSHTCSPCAISWQRFSFSYQPRFSSHQSLAGPPSASVNPTKRSGHGNGTREGKNSV